MRHVAAMVSDGGTTRTRGVGRRGSRRRVLASVALPLVLLAACAGLPLEGGNGLPLPSGPSGGGTLAAQESEAHRLVNAHRAAIGLRPLAYDERLAAIAREHSQRMASGARGFGHDDFDARAAEIRRFLQVRSLAENVALDSRNPPAAPVVRGWIGSAGHRKNMEGAFTVTGIGAARAPDGTFYFTQLFVATR